jgi:hypothetical protein
MRPALGSLVAVSVFALSVGVAHAEHGGDRSSRGDDDWNGGGRHGHRSGHQGGDRRWSGHWDDRHAGGRPERWASSRWDQGSRFHGHGDDRPHRHFDDDHHHHDDDDAFAWLAIAGLTLVTIGALTETQQLSYESAQSRATAVPLGESVIWRDGNAHGSVTPVREGTTTYGRYCREFQQIVTIGGREENAYGTACRSADGSWEIVSPGN